MAKSTDLFSKRQIFDAVNNALARAMRPAPEAVSKKRFARLHKYAEALTKEVERLVAEELLRPEEAVVIFLSSALAVQHGHSGHRSEQLAEVATLVEPPTREEPGWIGVGLDGTLAHHDGWKGIAHIGKPVPAMLSKVKEELLASGKPVRIFTARVSGADAPEAAEHIAKWCKTYLGRVLPITHEKTMSCEEIWDDRVKQVRKNEGEFV